MSFKEKTRKSPKKKTATTHKIKVKKGGYEVTITEEPRKARKKTKSKVKKTTKPIKKKIAKKKPVTKIAKPTKVKKDAKKKPTEVHYHSTKEIKVEKALIENFIGLQKVMVNLSVKFDELSKQISKLLTLFEISAKSLAQKDFQKEKKDKETKQILEKLDKISEHSGLIGKGLALIHDINKEQGKPSLPTMGPGTPRTRSMPPRPRPQGMPGFQRSISSRVQEQDA